LNVELLEFREIARLVTKNQTTDKKATNLNEKSGGTIERPSETQKTCLEHNQERVIVHVEQ
jgi:hypothetical protein